jgi:[protein-PII] uridylyltransferase
MEIIAEQINQRLRDELNSTTEATQTLLSSNRKLKYFSTPTIVKFEKAEDNHTTFLTIETIDRTGMLANIAKTFIDCKIKVLNARIATAGEMALDSFTISTTDDRSLSEEQQKNLKQQLKEAL